MANKDLDKLTRQIEQIMDRMLSTGKISIIEPCEQRIKKLEMDKVILQEKLDQNPENIRVLKGHLEPCWIF